MLNCRACSAKDAELARVWKMLTELTDRYTALTGTLPAVVEAAQVRRDGETEDPELVETEQPDPGGVDWQESEIAQKELEIRKGGGVVRPDFPM
jgi:transposase